MAPLKHAQTQAHTKRPRDSHTCVCIPHDPTHTLTREYTHGHPRPGHIPTARVCAHVCECVYECTMGQSDTARECLCQVLVRLRGSRRKAGTRDPLCPLSEEGRGQRACSRSLQLDPAHLGLERCSPQRLHPRNSRRSTGVGPQFPPQRALPPPRGTSVGGMGWMTSPSPGLC